MLGSYLLLILFIFFYIRGNTKAIFAIIIISLTNDLFKLTVGFSLPIHYIISLLYIPKTITYYGFVSHNIKRIISPLFIEFSYLIILAIIMGFLFPWRSEFDYLRSWSQMSEGRALIQILRLFAELSLLLLVFYWLNTRQISINYLLKVISFTISISVFIAVADTYFNLGLKHLMFSEDRNLVDRFTALNTEPRSFGRICSIVLLLLTSFFSVDKSIIIKVGLILSIIGVIISFSASTYIMTLSWGLVFILFTRKFKYLLYCIPVLLLAVIYLSKNDFYKGDTSKKIETVLSINDNKDNSYKERVNSQEPDIFSHFEVFDRAALNFLYENPFYFLTGTGPNLISIPASPYLTKSTYDIYGDRIDSVPHSFMVNLIARSGIIGIIIWVFFFLRFKTALKGSAKENQALLIGLMVSQFLVMTPLFFLIIGLLLHIVREKEQSKKNKIKIYAEYHNAGS